VVDCESSSDLMGEEEAGRTAGFIFVDVVARCKDSGPYLTRILVRPGPEHIGVLGGVLRLDHFNSYGGIRYLVESPRRAVSAAAADPDQSVLNPSRHRARGRIELDDPSTGVASDEPGCADKRVPGKEEFRGRGENLQPSSLVVVDIDGLREAKLRGERLSR
jgi:hypothetical protein